MKTTLYFTLGGAPKKVVADATMSANHSGDVEVTEHPVEDGANIADHAKAKQQTLQLELLFADFPLDSTDGAFGRAREQFELLEAAKEAGSSLTVVVGGREFSNLAIKSLSAPQERSLGRALKCVISLVSIRVVRTQTVRTKPRTGQQQKPQVAPPVNDGAKATTPTPVAAVRRSLWSSGYHSDSGKTDSFQGIPIFFHGG